MFYPISQVFWPIFAPSNVLIFITAAAAVFALLLQSKLAAWLAAIGGCALIIGSFTPVSYWLTLPLENRLPHWRAGFQPPVISPKRVWSTAGTKAMVPNICSQNLPASGVTENALQWKPDHETHFRMPYTRKN
jgi:hypothetical protein